MSYVLRTPTWMQSLSFDVSPDSVCAAVGDTLTVTLHVTYKNPDYYYKQGSLYVALRADGYLDTYKSMNTSGRYRYFSVVSDSETYSPTGQTVDYVYEIQLTQNALAGMRQSPAALSVGVFCNLFVQQKQGGSIVQSTWSDAAETGLTLASDGYTMPTLSAMTYTDAQGMYGRFGIYIHGTSEAGMSFPSSAIQASASFGTISRYVLKLTAPDGADTYTYSGAVAASNVFDLHQDWAASTATAGNYAWELWLENGDGIGGVTTGSYTVVIYTPPALSFAVARYSQVIDAGTTYEESDDGVNVWLDINAVTTPLNGHNDWTLTLSYSPNDNGGVLPITLLSGSDGQTVIRTNDRSFLPPPVYEFASSNDYTFTATLTDVFGSYVVAAYIYKADGYFDVEKTGVAVGMRSTGEPTDRKFEVAEDYTSHFYGGIHADGGIAGVTTYPLLASGATATDEELTGGKWIDGKPIYRKVITWSGTLAATTTIGAYPSDLDTLVRCDVISNLSGATRPVPFNYYSNGNYDTNWYLQESTGNIVMQCGSSVRVAATVHFILEYTKPTN